MYFTAEWSEEALVGFLVMVEFVPPSLVAYYGEGLYSFFVEDEAVTAVFISQVFSRDYVDVWVGRARGSVVEVCRVDVHLFARCRASRDLTK